MIFFVCLFVFTHASPTNQITVEYLDTASHRLCALRPHTKEEQCYFFGQNTILHVKHL